jgi:hypothetical protein
LFLFFGFLLQILQFFKGQAPEILQGQIFMIQFISRLIQKACFYPCRVKRKEIIEAAEGWSAKGKHYLSPYGGGMKAVKPDIFLRVG